MSKESNEREFVQMMKDLLELRIEKHNKTQPGDKIEELDKQIKLYTDQIKDMREKFLDNSEYIELSIFVRLYDFSKDSETLEYTKSKIGKLDTILSSDLSSKKLSEPKKALLKTLDKLKVSIQYREKTYPEDSQQKESYELFDKIYALEELIDRINKCSDAQEINTTYDKFLQDTDDNGKTYKEILNKKVAPPEGKSRLRFFAAKTPGVKSTSLSKLKTAIKEFRKEVPPEEHGRKIGLGSRSSDSD